MMHFIPKQIERRLRQQAFSTHWKPLLNELAARYNKSHLVGLISAECNRYTNKE